MTDNDPGAAPGDLTPLQLAIVRLLAQGCSDDHVADRLGLGLRTVQRHVSRIMRHLHARSRFEAGVAAARAGLAGDARRN
ncbi:helix-turn-helix transcriptional regulator [Actinoplanes sp. NPDC049596]|uniref:response regulator transcription factor n=1 Tax=unclassified Actinoplanes TaxID=2626549 RepID=UPI00342B917C